METREIPCKPGEDKLCFVGMERWQQGQTPRQPGCTASLSLYHPCPCLWGLARGELQELKGERGLFPEFIGWLTPGSQRGSSSLGTSDLFFFFSWKLVKNSSEATLDAGRWGK